MLSKIVLDGLADWLSDSKWEFTEVGYHPYSDGGEYVELNKEALRKLIGEYFSSGHGNSEV